MRRLILQLILILTLSSCEELTENNDEDPQVRIWHSLSAETETMNESKILAGVRLANTEWSNIGFETYSNYKKVESGTHTLYGLKSGTEDEWEALLETKLGSFEENSKYTIEIYNDKVIVQND